MLLWNETIINFSVLLQPTAESVLGGPGFDQHFFLQNLLQFSDIGKMCDDNGCLFDLDFQWAVPINSLE